MKKRFLTILFLSYWSTTVHAADLVEVYKQAQSCDPIFQQAISQRFSTKEGVPISVATLLPNISANINPSISRVGYSGSNLQGVPGIVDGAPIFPRNVTQRAYTLNLTLDQVVFDFAKFSTVAEQVSLSRGADATLNAALQNLMIRVSTAYFAILKDEDNLSYSEASKRFYAQQLDQIKQQFNVGIKTQTDVYTAQASYDSSVAQYIGAQTTLSNDRENLRVITGVYYEHLSRLSDKFPLLSPKPANIEDWVKIAQIQNWSVRASRYNTASAREAIRQQEAGHLPTLDFQTNFSREYVESINKYTTFTERNGPGTTSDRSVMLTLNVPIFSGGGVVAKTNKAVYDYRVSQQQLEQNIRSTINTTRQSYNSIVAGIPQIKADQQAIKSGISSLQGLEASYRVGTETLVDVLNQQQNVLKAQTQYATDRYSFVSNILALKQAAGTLSLTDLCAINVWLVDK
jgi:outer membrane protein